MGAGQKQKLLEPTGLGLNTGGSALCLDIHDKEKSRDSGCDRMGSMCRHLHTQYLVISLCKKTWSVHFKTKLFYILNLC